MKKKFNLNDLKVKSFITSMQDNEEQTVKGGASLAAGCTAVLACGGTIGPIGPVNTLNLAQCINTQVDAICKGWHTMPYWDGCGSV